MNTKEFIQQTWVKEELKSRLDYDPETGRLTWKPRGKPWFDENFAGKEVGQKWIDKYNYKCATTNLIIKGRRFSVSNSRLCWLVQTGDWPKHTIDHINRDSWDNRWENLRDIPQSENNKNKGTYKTKNFGGISRDGYGFYYRNKGCHVGRSNCFGKVVKLRQQSLDKN